MPKNKLFDDDSEEDEVDLKTANNYAKNYDRWREKEELHKLEQKYGPKPTSDVSSSESEDESDGPPEITEEIETQFLKTLSLLKTKDPRIYDPNYKFFNEKVENEKEKPEDVKKVTFADSDDDDDDNPNIFSIEKKAVIEEPAKPENGKLKNYFTGKADNINEEIEKDLAPLKSLWSDPKLNDGEAFLRDYILNKRYLDTEETDTTEQSIRDNEDLEADEKTVEEQGKFERAYNFRFEEPDDEYLKRYPRTMNFIRPKDDRRSRKRIEIRDRKEEEKKKKMEEIARMKSLKLKEIQEKIAKIKEVTGNEELAFEESDIEGDFDPAEHDRRMKAIFDEQFYGQADDKKPVFPDLDEELEIENWEKFEEQQAKGEDEPHCEDEDFNMDADYDPKVAKRNLIEEMKRDQNKKRRNRKRKSKLAEILAQEKPKFTPQLGKTYAEYMDEYYNMDCEDVIGDMPTRFKYRDVVPNDYGLTIEEILLADDKELTQWVPLKKIVKYRPENIEKSEVNTYRQKAQDERLMKKILPSLFRDIPEEPEIVVPVEETLKTTKKNKKSKSKEASATNDATNDDTNLDKQDINVQDTAIDSNQKSKKKRKHQSTSIAQNGLSDDKSQNNLISQDTNTEKIQSKKKKKSKKTIDNDIEYTGPSSDNIRDDKTEKTDQNIQKQNKLNIEIATPNVTNKLSSNSDKSANTEKTIKTKLDNVKPKKAKKKQNSFIVEDVTGESNKASTHARTKVAKRKANNASNIPKKKTKKQWKSHVKNENTNPLAKLSDERLKAYGLNPKKYRSFLKYKKF